MVVWMRQLAANVSKHRRLLGVGCRVSPVVDQNACNLLLAVLLNMCTQLVDDVLCCFKHVAGVR